MVKWSKLHDWLPESIIKLIGERFQHSGSIKLESGKYSSGDHTHGNIDLVPARVVEET